MDKTYWESYYSNQNAANEPSKFAGFVAKRFLSPSDCRLIELGCGNGRDASFFGSIGANVLAIDQASSEIAQLRNSNRLENVKFQNADFTSLEPVVGEFDIVYSRFTLHSIRSEEQDRVLAWSAGALKPGGHLCIEVRGYKNGLYKKGEPVSDEPDAYIYDKHYRRFIDRGFLDKAINYVGLTTVLSVEDRGFAPTSDTNDFFIRHVSKKQ